MIPATWFRKGATPEASSSAAPASDPQPATPPPAIESAAPPVAEEPVKVEAAAPPEKDIKAEPRPAPTAASKASRLVEAGSKGSSSLKARLAAAAAGTRPWAKPAAAAAAILVAGTLGYAGGQASAGRDSADDVVVARWAEAASGIRENREDVARLASDMKAIRTALDGLRNERRGGDPAARQAQLIERSAADTSAKIARLAEQLERIEKTQRDPARLGALVERLDRIEKQVQTASAAPVPAAASKPVAAAQADVTQTGSLPTPVVDARPPARPVEPVDPRKQQAEGYVLRDIEDGFALVEGRNGRFFEVAPGMNLPGLGRVEAIERRGRQWVVVTPKGYVAER